MLVVCDVLDDVVVGVVVMGLADVVVVTGGWVGLFVVGGGGGGGGGLPGSGGGETPLLEVVDGAVVLDGLLVDELGVVVVLDVVVVVGPGTTGASETRSPRTGSLPPEVLPCSAAEVVTRVATVANRVAVASATAPSTAVPGTRWPCFTGATASALTCRTPASTPSRGCPGPCPVR